MVQGGLYKMPYKLTQEQQNIIDAVTKEGPDADNLIKVSAVARLEQVELGQ